MKFITLIPVIRNNGTKVSEDELKEIFQQFYTAFGACTLDGRTQGFWIDQGHVYEDECVKIVVACDDDRLEEAETLVREIGRQLGQLAMYFEVDWNADIRILRID